MTGKYQRPAQRRSWKPMIGVTLAVAVAAGLILLRPTSRPAAPRYRYEAVMPSPDTTAAPNLTAPPLPAPSSTPSTAASSHSTTSLHRVDPTPLPVISHIFPTTSGISSSPAATLSIASLRVNSPILPEGIDQTPGDIGNLAVPSDVHKTAWWDGGPAPGQPGVAVLAGHRSSAVQGEGALWTLPSIKIGAEITVIGTDGTTTHWTVASVQQIVKSQLPDSLWATTGPPQLAVVTCGGQFNTRIGHYDDNVIVWAVPFGS